MSFILKWFRNLFFVDDGQADSEYPFDHSKYSEITVPSKESGNIKRGRGVVTFISPDYGLIDNKLYFDARVAPKHRKLTVGETVQYSSFKASENETERIVDINDSEEYFSRSGTDELGAKNNERISSKTGDSSVGGVDRVLSGKISSKHGEDLFIQPLNVRCNLRNVQCSFAPIEGDWVSVVAEVSINADAFNYLGGILQIKSLNPLLVKQGTGVITHFSQCNGSDYGVIENEIYFSADFCQLDFSFNFGDQVTYKAIESDQVSGKYKWRAVTVLRKGEAETGNGSAESTDSTRRKNGIEIEGNLNFGPLEMGETQEVTLTVKNNGNENHVLERCSFSASMKRSQLRQKSPKKQQEILIEPGDSVDFVFECKANYLGLSSEIVTFQFKNFKIAKEFNVDVGLGGNGDDLRTSTEARDATRKPLFGEHFDLSGAMFGKRPTSTSRFTSRSKTPTQHYPLPEKLLKVVLGEGEDCKMDKVRGRVLQYAPCLRDALNWSNYRERFHVLLYLEEIQRKITYRKYDLHGVILRKRGKYLEIDVSDLVNADSIFTIGTTVVVTQPWSEANSGKQVGYVHECRGGVLLVLFHESFHAIYDESECDVIFQPIRTPFIRCHAAVDLAVERLNRNWLFPAEVKEKPPVVNVSSTEPEDSDNSKNLRLSSLMCDVDEDGYVIPRRDARGDSTRPGKRELNWFNPYLNELQKEAVTNVLEGKYRPLPYVVFGPPGTGKTLTIVEVALQIYTLISHSRLLIGAPSNSAADVICYYLISTGKFIPGELVRILAQSRAASQNVPENIMPYCATIMDDHMTKPNLPMCDTVESVGSQRIVISTCNNVGMLHTMGYRQGHFSHIIIDEAAQASEPEALIPISFLDPKVGQVVICGDTEQLGPVSTGFRGKDDLSKSFLERICKMPPYARNDALHPLSRGFDPRCITRLRDNYRSVPELLKLPSRLFYNSELIARLSQESGPEAEIIRRFNFESENRKSPPAIIFHGIRGVAYQEQGSHSWYNPLEIWQSISYLKRLYSIKLTPDDVGIITPYQKQVEKLRQLLSKLNVPVPKIGSVEEFQGQERNAIILSTVRSSVKIDEVDGKILGFVASPRRINVAITRACAILIIVGNPFTLRLDPYWSAIIQYCVSNNSCTGCSFEGCFNDKNADK